MKAYISLARAQRVDLDATLTTITSTIAKFKIESLIFVDRYSFDASQEKEMMQQAMSDIDSCDLFIAEVSEKAIGVGLEAGYAKAKGKTIIYLRRHDAEHSTTVAGISDHKITYRNLDGLRDGLAKIIKLWLSQRN